MFKIYKFHDSKLINIGPEKRKKVAGLGNKYYSKSRYSTVCKYFNLLKFDSINTHDIIFIKYTYTNL